MPSSEPALVEAGHAALRRFTYHELNLRAKRLANWLSGFGIQKISGYAKVYSSVQKTKDLEQEYILARNKLIEADKKAKKEG